MPKSSLPKPGDLREPSVPSNSGEATNPYAAPVPTQLSKTEQRRDGLRRRAAWSRWLVIGIVVLAGGFYLVRGSVLFAMIALAVGLLAAVISVLSGIQGATRRDSADKSRQRR